MFLAPLPFASDILPAARVVGVGCVRACVRRVEWRKGGDDERASDADRGRGVTANDKEHTERGMDFGTLHDPNGSCVEIYGFLYLRPPWWYVAIVVP